MMQPVCCICTFPRQCAMNGFISICKAHCGKTDLKQFFLGRQWYIATREKTANLPSSKLPSFMTNISAFAVNKIYTYLCRDEILYWHLHFYLVIHHHSGVLPVNL